MSQPPDGIVYVLPGQKDFTSSLVLPLLDAEFTIRCIRDWSGFLDGMESHAPGCMIVQSGSHAPDLLSVLKAAQNQDPAWIVVVAGKDISIESAVQAMRQGAMDVLELTEPSESIVERVQYSLAKIGKTPKPSPVKAFTEKLTVRQIEVVRLLMAGKQTKEIAFILSRSARTIETHRAHIKARLNVNSVAEIIRMAWECGLEPYEESDPDT